MQTMKVFKAILSKGDSIFTTAEDIAEAASKLQAAAKEREQRVILVTEDGELV